MNSLGVQLSTAIVLLALLTDEQPVVCEHPQNTVVMVGITKTGKKTSLKTVFEFDGKKVEQETPGIELEDNMTIQYADTIVAIHKGKLIESNRAFGDVKWKNTEAHLPPIVKEAETKITSEKSGAEQGLVRFQWDTQAKKYTATFLDKQLDQDTSLLEHMVPSVSALFLSPSNSPSRGQSWPIPIVQLRGLILYPGGDLFLVPESETRGDAQERGRLRSAYWGGLTGEIEARIVANPEGRGDEYATIEIKGNGLVHCEVRRGDGGTSQPLRKINETALIEGVAVWDIKQNHLHHLVIDWNGDLAGREPAKMDGATGTSTLMFRNVCHWEMDCQYPEKAK